MNSLLRIPLQLVEREKLKRKYIRLPTECAYVMKTKTINNPEYKIKQ